MALRTSLPGRPGALRRVAAVAAGLGLVGAVAAGCGTAQGGAAGPGSGAQMPHAALTAAGSTTTTTTTTTSPASLPACGSLRDPFDPTGSPPPAGSPALC